MGTPLTDDVQLVTNIIPASAGILLDAAKKLGTASFNVVLKSSGDRPLAFVHVCDSPELAQSTFDTLQTSYDRYMEGEESEPNVYLDPMDADLLLNYLQEHEAHFLSLIHI